MAGVLSFIVKKGEFIGTLIYIIAGAYLMFTKQPDKITAMAFAAILAMAVLAITKYSYWAAIGGAFLISASVLLQNILAYWCLNCITADYIILIGVLILSITEKGQYKKILNIMACLIALFLTFNSVTHIYKSPASAQPSDTYPEAASGPENFNNPQLTRYFTVTGLDGQNKTLDTAETPVLLFSPRCGACDKAIDALVSQDPEGKKWIPVQTSGRPEEGGQLLKEKGYRGNNYSTSWTGAVPAMVVTNEDKITKTYSPDKMAAIIGEKK